MSNGAFTAVQRKIGKCEWRCPPCSNSKVATHPEGCFSGFHKPMCRHCNKEPLRKGRTLYGGGKHPGPGSPTHSSSNPLAPPAAATPHSKPTTKAKAKANATPAPKSNAALSKQVADLQAQLSAKGGGRRHH